MVGMGEDGGVRAGLGLAYDVPPDRSRLDVICVPKEPGQRSGNRSKKCTLLTSSTFDRQRGHYVKNDKEDGVRMGIMRIKGETREERFR